MRPIPILPQSLPFIDHTTSNDWYVFAPASCSNQARPEELCSDGVCYGISDQKEAMKGENLNLHPGHVALGKLLSLHFSRDNSSFLAE